jgi:hypothetical protein
VKEALILWQWYDWILMMMMVIDGCDLW